MIALDLLPYFLLIVFSALVSGFVAMRTYQSRRKVARAASFTTMALCGSLWMLLTALNTLNIDLAWKEVLWWLIPFALLSTLIGLFFFTLEFSLRLKQIPKVILYSTVVTTLVIVALSVTNYFHHLMWTVSEVNGRYFQVMGKLFLVQLAYTYLLTFSSLILLIRAFLLSKGILRRQTGLLLVGILIPVLVSLITEVFGWEPLPNIDLSAVSIVFTVVFFGFATLRFNVFYLLPVASDMIIKNIPEGILVTDGDGLVIFSNPAVQKMIGKGETQINGHPVMKVLAGWLPEALQVWNEGKADVQLVSGEEHPQFFHLTNSPLAGNANESIGHLFMLRNNTEQMNYENRLHELAIRDSLTGSYNRGFFFEMANLYFNQMLRASKPLSVLFIDLDHFKRINDTYGHLMGDMVLQKVAGVCRSLVRTPDIFSRYGGEEFVLVMPETALQHALLVAERLRAAIESLKDKVEGIPVTASIGVVETTGETGLTLDILLNRADEAMYSSKNAGRNRITAWKND